MPKCLEVTSCQLSVVVAGGSVSRDARELIDEHESFSHMAGDVLYHLFAQADKISPVAGSARKHARSNLALESRSASSSIGR